MGYLADPADEGFCEACGRPIVGLPRSRDLGVVRVVACGDDCLAVEILKRLGLPSHANILRTRLQVLGWARSE